MQRESTLLLLLLRLLSVLLLRLRLLYFVAGLMCSLRMNYGSKHWQLQLPTMGIADDEQSSATLRQMQLPFAPVPVDSPQQPDHKSCQAVAASPSLRQYGCQQHGKV